ncbi:MAG: DUF2306 domain-containing protein [Planctomycetes bacterium]|nr:DUF2306 domain-containing protein [Planctomycetota bacterium]
MLRITVPAIDSSNRLSKLRAIAAIVTAVLFAKVLFTILLEYRWYFPPDFESSVFLSGRRPSFVGVYRAAFYAHIVSGPVAVMLGAFLMLTGGRLRYLHVHRIVGRSQMLIVLVVVVPSGLVMARRAFAGPIAACGFASLAVGTALCATAALYCVRNRRIDEHQRWATRCFLLLASPLLLRLVAGAVIVMQLESDWFYRLNAWLSWIIPLVLYETWSRNRASNRIEQYNGEVSNH